MPSKFRVALDSSPIHLIEKIFISSVSYASCPHSSDVESVDRKRGKRPARRFQQQTRLSKNGRTTTSWSAAWYYTHLTFSRRAAIQYSWNALAQTGPRTTFSTRGLRDSPQHRPFSFNDFNGFHSSEVNKPHALGSFLVVGMNSEYVERLDSDFFRGPTMGKLRWQFRLRSMLILVVIAALLTSAGLWGWKMRQRWATNRARAPYYRIWAGRFAKEALSRKSMVHTFAQSVIHSLGHPNSEDDHAINYHARAAMWYAQQQRVFERAATHPWDPVLPLLPAAIEKNGFTPEPFDVDRNEIDPMSMIPLAGKTNPSVPQRSPSEQLKWLISVDELLKIDLNRLDLREANISDAVLANLAPLENLEELYLSGRNISDAGLANLAQLKNLKALQLSGNFTDAGLANLAPLKNLEVLELNGTNITDAGLANLAPLKNLKSLDLRDTKVTGAGVANFGALKMAQLRSLDLTGLPVDDVALLQLKGSARLEELHLGGTRVGDAGLAAVAGMTQLRTLILEETAITDAGLVHLRGLTQLQELFLSGTNVGDAGLVHLRGLTQLRWLFLSGTKVGDAGLAHLEGLDQLQWLTLPGTSITDSGLVHLKGLTNLRTLTLAETDVSDTGLVHLAGLSNLEALQLARTKVTNEGLIHLKGLMNLSELYLSQTDVSDAGLVHLAGLANLKVLGIDETKVTDAGLVYLRGLNKLDTLYAADTLVTPAGAESLKQWIPGLDVTLIAEPPEDPPSK
jgi:internalin A